MGLTPKTYGLGEVAAAPSGSGRSANHPKDAQSAPPLEEEGWDHETYLAAVLAEEVTETHGDQHRVKAARFPQVTRRATADHQFFPISCGPTS